MTTPAAIRAGGLQAAGAPPKSTAGAGQRFLAAGFLLMALVVGLSMLFTARQRIGDANARATMQTAIDLADTLGTRSKCRTCEATQPATGQAHSWDARIWQSITPSAITPSATPIGLNAWGYAGIQEQVVCEVCPKRSDHGCHSVRSDRQCVSWPD